LIRFLSICLDASLEQFLGNGDLINYSKLIKTISIDLPFDLVFQKLKDSIISKQELHACVILNAFFQMDSTLSKEEFISHTEKGFVDYLLKMIKLDPIPSLIQISCDICLFLFEFGKTKEMNLILQEMIDSLKEEDPNIDEDSNINIIFEYLTIISDLNAKIEINFKEFLEFILDRHEYYLFHYTRLLVIYRFAHEELIPIVFEILLEILSVEDMLGEINEPYQNLAAILGMIRYDFRPYIAKTIKLSVIYIKKIKNEEVNGVFMFLHKLVEVFGEECEIYISKYNLVPMTIEIMSANYARNRIFQEELAFPIRFLVIISFNRFKLFENFIPSILKESNKLQSMDRM
jgi:hypothetical protein